jgi:hypothetical protein
MNWNLRDKDFDLYTDMADIWTLKVYLNTFKRYSAFQGFFMFYCF